MNKPDRTLQSMPAGMKQLDKIDKSTNDSSGSKVDTDSSMTSGSHYSVKTSEKKASDHSPAPNLAMQLYNSYLRDKANKQTGKWEKAFGTHEEK